MLSYEMMSAVLMTGDTCLEVSIREASLIEFSFAAAPDEADFVRKAESAEVSFFLLDEYRRQTVRLSSFTIHEESADRYEVRFRLETMDPAYKAWAGRMMAGYTRFIELKEEGGEPLLASAMTGIPSGDRYPPDWQTERAALLNVPQDDAWRKAYASVHQFALELNSRARWQLFLNETDWQAALLREAGLPEALAGLHSVTHMYIGDAFCPQRFPPEDLLVRMLQRCEELTITPVIVLAPAAEERTENVRKLLELLNGHARELVINDWGTMLIAAEEYPGAFELTLGPLLNKRRRDVRLPWKLGAKAMLPVLASSPLHQPQMTSWLHEHGVSRIGEYCCGYTLSPVPDFKTALHLPFYPMNTAAFCTMKDACGESRNAACSYPCERQAFLYPEDRGMIGVGNTLFGFDRAAWTDGEYLRSQMTDDVDRIVLTIP